MVSLERYDLEDLKHISSHLKSPFTNTKSKRYKSRTTKLLENMKSNMIYHYVNQFDAHFLMFKYRKLHQVIILGPFYFKDRVKINVSKCFKKSKLNIPNLPS